MEPKNKTDRVKAFMNFLLLFLLCIAVIITTVFFSIQVPFKQNDELRRQISIIQRERAFATDFLTEMTGIVSMLDTVSRAPNPDLLDRDIAENIKSLDSKVKNADSVYGINLYQNVVQNMYELQRAKKQARQAGTSEEEISKLQKANADLTSQLETYKSLNAILQANQRR